MESSVCALLGPTNTGKTHRAIDRMLEHRSGMMGLPLRLLAREVYDRVSARCGESQVALVTGEEKRIPRRPKYWICTVEAMPVATEVDFIAVDEVQLAAHPERGHVFTERLLRARGAKETWLLGAETMRDAISELVPEATILKSPRLSTLRGAGQSSLASLPKRSAVVAFSLQRVFELAERMKHKRGGAAVVVGALSPRARNAQVAMYQAREVDFLVATDAIGMGLNLDIDHVAFADTRKFDGRAARHLDTAEIAQIAGRAGRYVRDGTFGVLAPQAELPVSIVRAVEAHRFESASGLWWRNAELDWSSVDGLTESLRRGSVSTRLKRTERASDQAVLAALADRPEIRALAIDEDTVKLLWAACSIPDYRQLLFEDHVGLVARVFEKLASQGRLERGPIERQLDRLERPETDLDALMDHIASIRTWNYIANQGGWLDDASSVQERARTIEDALSDALHAVLVARFVDRGKRARARSSEARPKPPAGSPFAKLAELADRLPVAASAPTSDDVVERAIEAGHGEIAVDERGMIGFAGHSLGRLVRSRSLSTPEVVITFEAEPGAKLRLSRRLLAWSRDLVSEIVASIHEIEGLSSSGRGLAHALGAGLGTVLVRDVAGQLASLTEEDRARFVDAGVVLGSVVVYLASSLKPPAVIRRIALASVFVEDPRAGPRRKGAWPRPGDRSIAPARGMPVSIYTAVGYPVVGGRAVRADVLERFATRLMRAKVAEESIAASKLASWLGCRAAEAEEILAAVLGPT